MRKSIYMSDRPYLVKKEDLDSRNSEIEKLDTESDILLQLIEWMKLLKRVHMWNWLKHLMLFKILIQLI